jgi:hypothetical protein
MKLSREKIAYNSYKVPQPKVLDKNALALDRVFREVSILNTVFSFPSSIRGYNTKTE